MKARVKLIAALLALFLLCGCAAKEAEDAEAPAQTETPSDEPSGEASGGPSMESTVTPLGNDKSWVFSDGLWWHWFDDVWWTWHDGLWYRYISGLSPAFDRTGQDDFHTASGEIVVRADPSEEPRETYTLYLDEPSEEPYDIYFGDGTSVPEGAEPVVEDGRIVLTDVSFETEGRVALAWGLDSEALSQHMLDERTWREAAAAEEWAQLDEAQREETERLALTWESGSSVLWEIEPGAGDYLRYEFVSGPEEYYDAAAEAAGDADGFALVCVTFVGEGAFRIDGGAIPMPYPPGMEAYDANYTVYRVQTSGAEAWHSHDQYGRLMVELENRVLWDNSRGTVPKKYFAIAWTYGG